MKNKPLQTGMTLIEIMVSLLIGAFLLGGVLQTFVGSRQTNQMLEGLSRMQENGRYALDILATDIRMAGFIGCNRPLAITNTLNMPAPPGNFIYRFGVPVEGFEAAEGFDGIESAPAAAWTPAKNPAIPDADGGSDIITIRHADHMNAFTIASHPTGPSAITLDATATVANLQAADFLDSTGLNNCALAVASTCSAATIFQINAIAGNTLSHALGGCGPGNSTADLGASFQNGQVHPINTISYYVMTSNGQPALYRKVGGNAATPLVEGIEQMQVWYGVDTDATADGTANYYVTANQLAATDRVISVRISLLAVSLERVASGTVQYTYNGNLTQTDDGLLRRVFTSTISVRNR
ncbi:MAG: PilW family protein [Methylovulum miyakonense]|uniref:PilW family protein n=1 Tax=Methylovulum miyakonense TaxID=645578 RepID=UPI003BB5A0A7